MMNSTSEKRPENYIWRLSESSHRKEWSHWVMTAGDREAVVAAVAEWPDPEKSNEHASLICAAPQLLKACQLFLSSITARKKGALAIDPTYEDWQTVEYAVRKAIADAQGGYGHNVPADGPCPDESCPGSIAGGHGECSHCHWDHAHAVTPSGVLTCCTCGGIGDACRCEM